MHDYLVLFLIIIFKLLTEFVCNLIDVNSAICTILGPPPAKKQRISPVADDYDYSDQVGMHRLKKIFWYRCITMYHDISRHQPL